MDPENIQITSIWRSGLSFEATGKSGISVSMGSGGGEPANTPMELVLMALAGCTGMDVVSVLEKKRQPVSGLEIQIAGRRAEDHPRVYIDIDIHFALRGPLLTEEAVARAIELSETKYCSVGGMLQKTARIHTSYKILPPEGSHE